jgi:hypothetical protein
LLLFAHYSKRDLSRLAKRYVYHLLKEFKLIKKTLTLIIFTLLSLRTEAASNSTTGKIVNLTAIKEGIMIKVSGSLPDNCNGTPYNWILVKQEYTALTSVVLALWMSKDTSGTFYTSGRVNGSGFCILYQFDPAG